MKRPPILPRLLSLLLLCALLTSVVACTPADPPEESESSSSTGNPQISSEDSTTGISPGETDPSAPNVPDGMIPLVENGKCHYRIVLSDRASSEVMAAATKLLVHFMQYKVKLESTTDWEDSDPNTREILIGETKYTPEGAIDFDISLLGTTGSVTKVLGNKIIIDAPNASALGKAVDDFILNFCTPEDRNMDLLTIPEDYCKIESNGFLLGEVTLADKPLQDYTISVENAAFEESATLLAAFLKERCIVDLERDGSGPKILLTSAGATAGSVSASFQSNNLVITAANVEEMKKAVTCFAFDTFSGVFGTLSVKADLQYSKNLSDVVFYSDYVTPQNNICCLDAIINAHNAANTEKKPVYAEIGATYYISSPGKTATITTNTVWGNAKFTIDDTKITPDQRGNWIFSVPSLLPTSTLNLTSISRGSTNLGITLPERSIVTLYDHNTLRYIRSGGNENDGSVQVDSIIVNPDGSIDSSAPLIWDFGTITASSVRAIEDTTLTLLGGHFITIANTAPSAYTYYARGISIGRSNTDVIGIRHDVVEEGPTGAPYTGFLSVNYCAYVSVENSIFTGHKTYQTTGSAGSTVSMGSYDLAGGNVLNLTFLNCTQTNDIQDNTYWGILGTNYCKNMVYDGCVLSRFDAHQGVANATIRNSIIGHQAINAIGFGTFLIENTTVYAQYFVNLRSDYGSTWEGTFIFRNCTFVPTVGDAPIINGSNKGNHDYGYTCYMPETILIENFHIATTGQTYLFANINSNYKSESYVPEYPYIVTKTVQIKNLTTSNKKDIKISKNDFMFVSTIVTIE